MERTIIEKLNEWKNSKRRKPLILRGARQVGKTWILERFGESFKDGFLRIDLEKQKEYRQLFEQTKEIPRILTNISMASGKKITTDTLLILDEIQSCPDALNSLKYFCEDASEYYVAAAGSLLGITLAEGFPVGKVDFLELAPMTFEEFLLADGKANLVEYMKTKDSFTNIPDAFFLPLTEKLKEYFIVGGMPEPVLYWTEDKNIMTAERAQENILLSYESDFGKHIPASDVPKTLLIWNSLPSQLAKENKKFLYSAVKSGARAREYENALNWLIHADLVKKTGRITKAALPVSAYEDNSAFKIYMLDIGLLRKHSRLDRSVFTEGNRLFIEFNGALTENYVLQSLLRQTDRPYYWAEQPHEVDFVFQYGNEIYPVEVKAGKNIESASLKAYLKKYPETPLAIRFSLRNLSFDGKVLNIPLFMADETSRLIGLAKQIKTA